MPDYTRLNSTAYPSFPRPDLPPGRRAADPGGAADAPGSDPAPLCAAIYARSATGDPAALRHQEACCRAHAAAMGWHVAGAWAEGGSGLAPDLPGLTDLLATVEGGAAGVVLVTTPDRISRDGRQWRAVADRLGAAGVAVACVDGDPPSDTLRAAIAHWLDAGGAR